MSVFTLLAARVTGAATTQQASWFTVPVALSLFGICIALTALTIAFLNFRFSRFPHVRVKCKIYSNADHQSNPPKSEDRFDVTVLSFGLPIWDMRVMLVANYCGDEYDPQMGFYYLELVPVCDIPNPMNAGQVAMFRTSKTAVQGGGFQRKLGMSDLPLDRVAIVVYGSGEREIKRISSERFPFAFRDFDSLNGKPTRRKGDKMPGQEELANKSYRTRKPFQRQG